MIIIFGWIKEENDFTNFTQCYCYNCSEVKRWVLHTEIEWVSFFAIKTIPLLIKRDIYCERCGDTIRVPNLKFLSIRNNQKLLASYIEDNQLLRKSELQRKYLLNERERMKDESL